MPQAVSRDAGGGEGAFSGPRFRASQRVALALSMALCPAIPSAADMVPVRETVDIPEGPFIAGSDRAEREAAYRLDEAAYGPGCVKARTLFRIPVQSLRGI